MRHIGILIIIIVWILIGVKMCQDWNECCNDPDSQEISQTDSSSEDTTTPAPTQCPDVPICFMKNSGEPQFGSGWPALRDSIKNILGSDQKLRIIGTYASSEENNSGHGNVGLWRANSIVDALGLADDEVEVGSQLTVGQTAIVAGASGDLIQFSLVGEESTPIASGTLIYFPFNSTERISDPEIERYLDQVAEKVRDSGERIRLVGHTDNIGGEESNMTLGRQRAEVIKAYLTNKGVPAARCIVESMGESRPVASNNTDQGRAQNRRTELQIIQ